MTLSEQYSEDMLPVRVILLTQGKFALVDLEDYEMLTSMGPWHARKGRNTWYAYHYMRGSGRVGRAPVPMHGFITGFPVTDHINRSGLDNRRVNLRNVTYAENARNSRLNSRNTSGYRGVSYDKRSGKWKSYYWYEVDGRRKQAWIGLFPSPEEASYARTEWLKAEGIDASY